MYILKLTCQSSNWEYIYKKITTTTLSSDYIVSSVKIVNGLTTKWYIGLAL